MTDYACLIKTDEEIYAKRTDEPEELLDEEVDEMVCYPYESE